MKRTKLISKQLTVVQETVDRWAKKQGILKHGECVVVSLYIVDSNCLRMTPQDFFSCERLMSSGAKQTGGAIAQRAIWEMNWLVKLPRNPYESNPPQRRIARFRTMKEFSVKYDDVSDLYRIPNWYNHHRTIRAMTFAMRKAGFPITDSRDLLEKYKDE